MSISYLLWKRWRIQFFTSFFLFIISLFIFSCAVDEGTEETDPSPSDEILRSEYIEQFSLTCLDELVEHSGSEVAGFESSKAFGPPAGEGEDSGTLDVFVVGDGESAVLSFSAEVPVDGTTLVFYENGFVQESLMSWDLGWIEISPGGAGDPDSWDWYGWPIEYSGEERELAGKAYLAGMQPALANYETPETDPREESSGGDFFSLSEASEITDYSDGNPLNFISGNTLAGNGVESIRYVRISDGGTFFPDGQVFSNGIDVDAVCAFSSP